MGTKVWANLPPGASHISDDGIFYKPYNMGWLYWNTYHKSWIHSESVIRLTKLDV